MRERASLTLVTLLLLAAIVVTAATYLVSAPVEASEAGVPLVSVVATACGEPLPDGAPAAGGHVQVVGDGTRTGAGCPDGPAR
jgi:hypothetical protein